MSRRLSFPTYRLHKQSGQAVVTLSDGLGGRRDVLLGKFNTPESRSEYTRVIAEWQANGQRLPQRGDPAPADVSVNELLLAYYRHVEGYYRHPDGRPTSEVGNIRRALRRVRELYGHSPAASFHSLSLEAVRNRMIADGLCRTRINRDIHRIRRMFKWGAGQQLVPLSAFQSLLTVEGLRAGRSAATEREPVKPVPVAFVEATLPYLLPQTRAMAELQLHTGMRPGEALIMRTIDLDTAGPVWFYRPGSDQGEHGAHKTAWHGKDRVIALGPKAQEILKPWLRLNVAEYLFQPREARAHFNAQRRAERKSKVPPSQAARRPKRSPKKAPRDHYTASTYAQAIGDACRKAGVPAWSPNRLRHNFATTVRRRYGLEAAQVLLGHSRADVTQVYAERDLSLAERVAAEIG